METIVEDLIQEVRPAEGGGSVRSRRTMSIVAALALVVGGLVLARSADTPAPATKVVSEVEDRNTAIDGAGAVLGQSLGFGAQTQIDVAALIRAIVCPILNALATGPLGGFIGPVINQLRVAFGCASG